MKDHHLSRRGVRAVRGQALSLARRETKSKTLGKSFWYGTSKPPRLLAGLPKWIFLCGALLFSFGNPDAVRAQLPLVTEPNSQPTVEPQATVSLVDEMDNQIGQCRRQIDKLTQQLADPNLGQPGALSAQLDEWRKLELISTQRASLLQEVETLGQEGQAAEAPTVPANFLELDDTRDVLMAKREEMETLRLELQAEEAMTSASKDQFEEAESARRTTAEQASLGTSAAATPILDKRLAALRSVVFRNQYELHKQQEDLVESRMALTQEIIDELEQIVVASQSKLQLQRPELEERLARMDAWQSTVEAQLAEIESRMRTAMTAGTIPVGQPGSTQLDIAREEAQLLQQLLIEVANTKECWRRRYELSSGSPGNGQMRTWLVAARDAQQRLELLSNKLRFRTQQRQQTLSALRRNVETENTPDTAGEEIAELERIIGVYGDLLVLLNSGERLYGRYIEELDSQLASFSWTSVAERISLSLSAAWQYEVFAIDDAPITVRKIVVGLLLLVIGWFASRFLSNNIAAKILPRLGMNESASSAVRSLLFYVFVVAIAFVSLEILNVPLTVFAFLGGAVAIGVGFGSQNLINNFISGLLLLVERPIRVGDLVNVDGIDANVEHVGARCTRVRTGSNLEIMVPNSKFLENNVTNWTLSDTRIRTSVSVGVAYGSPVGEVLHQLREAVTMHDKVLPSPEPIVLFQEFGDNALNFEVHFWVHMRRIMDGARVRSEIRASIDERFRRAGIVIAFPQRDIHLDTTSPIEIRLADPTQSHSENRLRAA